MGALRAHLAAGASFCAALLVMLASSPAVTAQHQAGHVAREAKIDEANGGFVGPLDHDDKFGVSLAALGDLDDDGVVDVAVGASGDDDGGLDRGAVWILFLNVDGTVKAEQKISSTAGGFTGPLLNNDRFARAVAGIGDLDGDGVEDLAVGSEGDDDGGSGRGAVWILFLNTDGTVKAQQKISDLSGGLAATLGNDDRFGSSIAVLGDLDGDDITDIAVGARRDDEGALDMGAMYVLRLNANGTVKAEQKINSVQGGFTGALDAVDFFGEAAMGPGDLDGDSIPDLIVGTQGDDDGGSNRGCVWFLYLNADGTVKGHAKISQTQGGFPELLGNEDYLGSSFAPVGDLDGNGVADLAVGARRDDDGGTNAGAIWILFLDDDETCLAATKISATTGNFAGTLGNEFQFAGALAGLGDMNGDGPHELICSAPGDNTSGTTEGAQWVLFLVDGPWVDLAHALAGVQGEPRLVGDGPLTGGSGIDIELSRAAPSSTAWLVFGLATLYLPFESGILVPDFSPPGNLLPLVTNGGGGLGINATWPTGVPGGVEIFFQYWIVDAAGPSGWAASNAVRATTP